MIVLFNPLSTSPGKQPLPLSLISLAAVLERASERWCLVDGNLTAHPAAEIIARAVPPAEIALLAVTVMPGPQLNSRLTGLKRLLLKAAGGWRYALQWYDAPYELRALHRLLRYQRPETTGF